MTVLIDIKRSLWPELVCWLAVYFAISFTYRFALNGPQQRSETLYSAVLFRLFVNWQGLRGPQHLLPQLLGLHRESRGPAGEGFSFSI